MNKEDIAIQFELLLKEYSVARYEGSIWAFPNYPHHIKSNYGWKIHISAILTNAIQIARKFLTLNQKYHFDFKIISSIPYLEQMNMGYFGNSQVGKFITIYPDQSAVTETLELLYYYFHDDVGIRVGSDTSYKQGLNVYYRYGTLLDDVENIDKRDKKLKPSSNVERIYDYRLKRYNSLPTRYLILKVIKQNGPSGVLLALDLQTKVKVIIRYAEKYYNIECAGIDERDRLISASSLLEKDFVRNSNFFETVVDAFYVSDAFFVVTEYISGHNLDELAKSGQLGSYSLSERLEIFRNVLKGIYILNENTVIFRDLSFSNVILCPNHTIKIIDFGYAISPSGLGSFAGLTLNPAGTYGFFDPETILDERKLDLYSLGKLLYYIVFPQSYLNYTSKINSDSTYWQIKEYVFESEQYQLPKRIAELYRLLIKGEKMQELDLNYLIQHLQ